MLSLINDHCHTHLPFFPCYHFFRLTNLFVILIPQPTKITSMWWNVTRPLLHKMSTLVNGLHITCALSCFHLKEINVSTNCVFKSFIVILKPKKAHSLLKISSKKGAKNIPFLDENISYLEGGRGGEDSNSLNQKILTPGNLYIPGAPLPGCLTLYTYITKVLCILWVRWEVAEHLCSYKSPMLETKNCAIVWSKPCSSPNSLAQILQLGLQSSLKSKGSHCQNAQ